MTMGCRMSRLLSAILLFIWHLSFPPLSIYYHLLIIHHIRQNAGQWE